MGFTVLASLFIVTILCSAQAGPGGSRCPPPSKVYFAKPVCRDDYDCKHGKVCCPNSSNMRSCAEPASGASAGYGDKYQSGGPCGNIKCMPYQKCVKDPRTGQMVCKTV